MSIRKERIWLGTDGLEPATSRRNVGFLTLPDVTSETQLREYFVQIVCENNKTWIGKLGDKQFRTDFAWRGRKTDGLHLLSWVLEFVKSSPTNVGNTRLMKNKMTK